MRAMEGNSDAEFLGCYCKDETSFSEYKYETYLLYIGQCIILIGEE